jgi:hypothetical protein
MPVSGLNLANPVVSSAADQRHREFCVRELKLICASSDHRPRRKDIVEWCEVECAVSAIAFGILAIGKDAQNFIDRGTAVFLVSLDRGSSGDREPEFAQELGAEPFVLNRI